MPEFIVKHSCGLCGDIGVGGAKNGALPVLAASILSSGTVHIDNLPNLTDIQLMLYILSQIGANIAENGEISYPTITNQTMDEKLVNKMRGSFLLAGPILARAGHVRISMPGGCPIGLRPIDLHLKGFQALGAEVETTHGYIDIRAERLRGERVYLDFPSVGATENIMMAASLAEGETVIENASAEPEISELAEFICAMGGDIHGAGSDTIHIFGRQSLGDAAHRIIPDRIEAGTYLIAFAITHGKGRICHTEPQHLTPVIAKLREMGARVEIEGDSVYIDASGELHGSDIKTMPFPGFPTDMQAQFTALLSIIEGTSMIVETVFENRFLHVSELNRMGAKIKTDGRTAVIEGTDKLTGAVVEGRDLRGGAALILAGAAAQGETVVKGIEHICRGYDDIAGKLRAVGCQVELC